MFEDMNRFIEQHALRPVIDKVYRFEDFPEAFRRVEGGGHFGKVVVGMPDWDDVTCDA
jgi:NADPH:quinone reductase-like Zn-dependent oxidoreductase